MTNKKELAIDTVAELFTAAFNTEADSVTNPCRIERTATLVTEADRDVRWFKQTFDGLPNLDFFVGISKEAQQALLGSPDTAEPEQENVAQQLSYRLERTFDAFARTLSTAVGTPVSGVSFSEEIPQMVIRVISFVVHQGSDHAGKLLIGLAQRTINALIRYIPFSDPAECVQRQSNHTRSQSLDSNRLDVLMNINLPVSISFGSVDMMLGEVLKLGTGSIVELDHRLNEPIDVVVNNCLVARGEVVVADGNYAIRVSEVVSPGHSA